MKEQLEKLEDAVMRLADAYETARKENASLKAALAEKEAALQALQTQTAEAGTRISQLIETLAADLPSDAN